MRSTWQVLALAVVVVIAGGEARPCTTFCLDGGKSLVFGKNYDWGVGVGMVVVNQRGVAKTAFTDDHPARWTSHYGSVTFNQYGREFPSGGMNEAGLVVELMWLDDTVYPEPDARGGLGTLQWIQYQLDVSATVDDVVASDKTVRITNVGTAKIHFLVADAQGGCAAVEFLGGRMVVHRGSAMPFRVLTNDTYESSVAYARRATDAGGMSSLERFARAAARTAGDSQRGTATIDGAFDLLADVAQGDYTQWSIVYDIGGERVWFRTRLNREIRWLDLAKLDFACGARPLALDANAPGSGDLAGKLTACTLKANTELVQAAFAGTEFLRGVSLEVQQDLARYPEHMQCAP
jgi:penicillin V acylase-like amidase (Ntn superfamily)